MINSLLDRPYRKIKIDRIAKEIDGEAELLYESREVLEEVKEHFQKQFREKNLTDPSTLPEKWAKQYFPKENIDKTWYSEVLNDINVAE